VLKSAARICEQFQFGIFATPIPTPIPVASRKGADGDGACIDDESDPFWVDAGLVEQFSAGVESKSIGRQ
jgi:hypothetical protein